MRMQIASMHLAQNEMTKQVKLKWKQKKKKKEHKCKLKCTLNWQSVLNNAENEIGSATCSSSSSGDGGGDRSVSSSSSSWLQYIDYRRTGRIGPFSLETVVCAMRAHFDFVLVQQMNVKQQV